MGEEEGEDSLGGGEGDVFASVDILNNASEWAT